MPRVSVVIPLYNKADHIRRTLDSVVAQTFDDFEVIVIDDGSTDDGPSIVASYTDERVRLVRQENAGPGAARNHGIRITQSTWVAPLDADDYWLPGFLKHTLTLAEANPDCQVVTCFWHVDPDKPNAMVDLIVQPGDPVGAYTLVQGLAPGPMRRLMARFGCRNTLARRDALLASGGFYEKSRNGEDLYLWLQLLLNYRIYMDSEVLAFHDLGASELSYGARQLGHTPLPRPIVSDSSPIRANCPPQYRAQLDTLLDALARREAWHQIQAGRVQVAEQLLADYPRAVKKRSDQMRFWFWLALARRQQGRPFAQWSPIVRMIHRSIKQLRIKSKGF